MLGALGAIMTIAVIEFLEWQELEMCRRLSLFCRHESTIHLEPYKYYKWVIVLWCLLPILFSYCSILGTYSWQLWLQQLQQQCAIIANQNTTLWSRYNFTVCDILCFPHGSPSLSSKCNQVLTSITNITSTTKPNLSTLLFDINTTYYLGNLQRRN